MTYSLTALLILAFVLALILLTLKLIIPRTIGSVGERLKQTENQLSNYIAYNKYLKRRDRVVQDEKLASILRQLDLFNSFKVLLLHEQRAQVDIYIKQAKNYKSFLDKYIPEYTVREVERVKDLLQGKQFDSNQLEAIVKRDIYNLVIAAAGSGKTRTLTGRVAYLIQSGAKPEEILALAYTKTAAEEMEFRLRSDYNIPNANVRTFHSIGRELARQSPNFRPGVADNSDQAQFIKEVVERLSADLDFAKRLLYFTIEMQTPDIDQDDFADIEKYYHYMCNQKYLTLTGIKVNSIAERDIANFLFKNKVDFQYEAPARWADRSQEYRQWRPDFFLPKHNLWIEHWAVDRQGKVPPWFSAGKSENPSIRYREGMEWKRSQFKKHQQKMLETFSYQYYEGILISGLRHQLERNGVILREMTAPEILVEIKRLMPPREKLNDLMFTFISKAKTNGLVISDITSRLASGKWRRRQLAFGSLMVRIWQGYEDLLKQNDVIDFYDMINYALEVARKSNGNLANRYTHILIDEFQDITDPQLELIQCLMRDDDNSTLFCVGDDRQNIFSFAGSNIYNILHFERRFPYPEQTFLSTNYRCPLNIVEASNHIAGLNKMKTNTKVVSASQLQAPIRLIEMPVDVNFGYEAWQIEKAAELLRQLIFTREKGEKILVLCRFNYPLERLKQEFPRHEAQGLKFLSIHRAKGMEADYILLLHCIRGRNGFPAEIMDTRLLDIVKKDPEDDTDKLEEERRLFYVAITRCRKQLFVFTSRKEKSLFINELEPYFTAQ